MTKIFSDEEVSGLAKVERDMEAGVQPHVICQSGRRWAFPYEVLDPLGINTGQQVSDGLLGQLLRRHVDYLKMLVATEQSAIKH